jgi:DNA adenine methylase
MRRDARPSIRWPLLKEEVARVVERLQLVWIERLSWDHCMDAYDRAGTFFYLDPPYRAKASNSYRHSFTDEDHAQLADRLLGAKGRWLLSCNDDDFIRRLYRHRGVEIEAVTVSYSLQARGAKRGAELLVRNY